MPTSVTSPTKASHINPFHIRTPYLTQFRNTTFRYFPGFGQASSNRDVMEPRAPPLLRLSTRSRFTHCCVTQVHKVTTPNTKCVICGFRQVLTSSSLCSTADKGRIVTGLAIRYPSPVGQIRGIETGLSKCWVSTENIKQKILVFERKTFTRKFGPTQKANGELRQNK